MGFVFHGKRPGRVPKPFSHYVRRDGDCHVWTGAKNSSGYGSYRYEGKPRKAHHVAYLMAHGFLPKSDSGRHGFVLMHTCDNRLCVNPEHLKLGTQGENVRDAISKNRVPHIVGKSRPARMRFDRDRARDLRAFGYTYQQIGDWLGVGARSVQRALTEM